jgi:hypothetical protein
LNKVKKKAIEKNIEMIKVEEVLQQVQILKKLEMNLREKRKDVILKSNIR